MQHLPRGGKGVAGVQERRPHDGCDDRHDRAEAHDVVQSRGPARTPPSAAQQPEEHWQRPIERDLLEENCKSEPCRALEVAPLDKGCKGQRPESEHNCVVLKVAVVYEHEPRGHRKSSKER
eukprot:Amastigsp_a850711_5.p5 type:complete len:121 gc:universal Amastigsp_a850711_5:813-451(-)